MLDRHADAWPVALDASDRLRELTGDYGSEYCLAEIATLAGDHETAVRYSRIYCKWLETHHQRNNLSTWAPTLGRSLCVLGRYEEQNRSPSGAARSGTNRMRRRRRSGGRCRRSFLPVAGNMQKPNRSLARRSRSSSAPTG